MPVATDPTISLGVAVPQPAAQAVNPLGTITSLLDIQQKANANALAQYQFMARQRAGQVISQLPGASLDDIATALMADPLTASGAIDTINSVRSMQKTILDMDIAKAGAARTVGEAFTKSLAAAYKNPEMIPGLRESMLAATPPQARPQAEKYIDSLTRALTDGVPQMLRSGDPQQQAQAAQTFQSRVGGTLLGAGMSEGTVRALSGQLAPEFKQITGPEGEPRYGIVGGGVLDPSANTFRELGQAISGGQSSVVPNALAPTGPQPLGPIRGPTLTQQHEMEASGKALGTIGSELGEVSKNLPEDLNRVNIMESALNKFQAGGFAEARAGLARVAQGFRNAGVGIPESFVNAIGNQDLPSTQVFQALARPEVINALKEAAQGTGRVMRSEVDAFLAMMSANTDPEAIRQMLNNAKYKMAVRYDQTQKFANYKGDPLKFYASYNRDFDPYSLATGTPSGLDFSPIDPSKIKGAPAGADRWLGWGEQGTISRAAVERLRAHPEEAGTFEKVFGLAPGGAKMYLGRR